MRCVAETEGHEAKSEPICEVSLYRAASQKLHADEKMKERKLNVAFFFFSYGGNGGIKSEVPDIREWFSRLIVDIKKDSRIDEVFCKTIADTPITMTRNQAVVIARQQKMDVVVMVDSDINPNMHEDLEDWKPFFPSSFDFLYRHYDQGPCVIAAPYCGNPDIHENMFVFLWRAHAERGLDTQYFLDQYTREEAALMRGIQPAAALPTGLSMYDIRAFELIEPYHKNVEGILDDLLAGTISKEEACMYLGGSWFHYEWKDQTQSEKGSTEDVQNTRDISLAGLTKLGYNPVYCNWDSPVGHWKPWCVPGRPQQIDYHAVGYSLRRALTVRREQTVLLGNGKVPDLPGLTRPAHPPASAFVKKGKDNGSDRLAEVPQVQDTESAERAVLAAGRPMPGRVQRNLSRVLED